MNSIPPAHKIRWTTAEIARFAASPSVLYSPLQDRSATSPVAIHEADYLDYLRVKAKIEAALEAWSTQTELGEGVIPCGIVFSDPKTMVPLAIPLPDSGDFEGVPDLIVEVRSPRTEAYETWGKKLQFYNDWGVNEYWVIECKKQQVEICRRVEGVLINTVALYSGAILLSDLLPGFHYSVQALFE